LYIVPWEGCKRKWLNELNCVRKSHHKFNLNFNFLQKFIRRFFTSRSLVALGNKLLVGCTNFYLTCRCPVPANIWSGRYKHEKKIG
jgi:hypothetical protein